MFEITNLAHTADIRVKIEASTLSELFLGGLKCMANLLKEQICETNSKFAIAAPIQIQAPDATVLLIDFLSEVLTKCYSERIVFCEMEVFNLTESHFSGKVLGKKVDNFDEDIKAVTYHEAEVFRNTNNRWQTNLIFDI